MRQVILLFVLGVHALMLLNLSFQTTHRPLMPLPSPLVVLALDAPESPATNHGAKTKSARLVTKNSAASLTTTARHTVTPSLISSPLSAPQITSTTSDQDAHAGQGHQLPTSKEATPQASEQIGGMNISNDTVDLPSSAADYLHNPKPTYPTMSRRLGEQGEVVLRVWVGDQGDPQKVLVDQTSGFERLDQAAINAVLGWRYVPGKRQGIAESMWLTVPLRFVLE